jgi:hypothetical protein
VRKLIMAVMLTGMVLAPRVIAQEKEKPAEPEKKPDYWKDSAVMRFLLVFTEYDGEKKVSSIPYTLVMHSNAPGRSAALRMGIRVPIETSPNQTTYMDVGTNLDGHADKTEDGRFQVNLSVEKSSLYWAPSDSKSSTGNASDPSAEHVGKQPVIQQFRAEINVLIKDGQTLEPMVATDPISGHTLKLDLTLNVIK